MKRRVSFLLMLILAFALTLALSSCGECKHEQTKTEHETTTAGDCKTAEKYDEVVYCLDCNEEISRISKKGELGTHVASEPVYENVDVLDCTAGGTADEVVYCSVARCGIEMSRKTGVEVAKAAAHKLSSKTIHNEAHTQSRTLEYCENCAYQSFSAYKSDKISESEHVYQPSTAGACKYCFEVLSTSRGLDYMDNGDGTYTLVGVSKNATLTQQLFVGYYNGKPVTRIAPEAFKNNQNIMYVTIGSCVEEIGENAFAGCKIKKVYTYDLNAWCNIKFGNAAANPASVAETFSPYKVDIKGVFSIPDYVTGISDYAFANLKAHTVYISAGVKTVGANAFVGCSSLVNVYLADAERTFAADAFKNCDNIRDVYADSLSSWLKNSFATAESNPAYFADKVHVGNALLEGTVVIPEGTTVIHSYAFANLGIVSVEIPDSVKTIEDGAFAGCSLLTNVDLGEGVTSIGDFAFVNCAKLSEIVIPDTVTVIGDSVFENCASLAAITLGTGVNSVGKAAFKGCSALKAIVLPAVLTTLSEEMFANCTSLASVEFGAGLTDIESNAFANCVSITAFEFTENIENIGDNAFFGCSALAELNLNANLQTIGAGAFKNCSAIKTILVPDSVTEIGLGAFEGCSSVQKLTVPFVGNKKDSSENYHFGFIFGAPENWLLNENEEKVQLLIPDNRSYVPYTLSEVVITGSTVIGEYAFSGCESIVTVKLPVTLTKVCAYAFEECTSLTAVYFPDLAQWCRVVFENYSANPLANANELYIGESLVTTLNVPAGITEILPYTFYGAAEIVEIVIPEGVKIIGRDSFSHATALSKITLPESLEYIGARAFAGCDNIETVAINDIASWCGITFVDIFANPLYYAGSLYVAGSEVTELVIPADVTEIKAYAFAGCDFISAITVCDGVANIGDYAFYGCSNTSLKSITLPVSVTDIGNSAFEGCAALESVGIGSVRVIGNRAFADCVALKTVVVPDTATVISNEAFSGCISVTNITLGAAVKTIGISAFYGCEALTSINVPGAVTSIGAYAFGNCDALSSVTFGQTSGWKANGIDVTDLTDAAMAAAKVTALSNSEWARS